MQEIQEAVIAKETEPQPQPQQTVTMFRVEGYCSDKETDSVIKALGSSSYTFRNIDGIIGDTNLPLIQVENSLNWLLVNHLSLKSSGIGGSVYSLTPKGRNVFASLLNQN